MSVTIVHMHGDETDSECKEIAWQMMCNAHPLEAHDHDPERFWLYFHKRCPHVAREQMEAVHKELKAMQDSEDESRN